MKRKFQHAIRQPVRKGLGWGLMGLFFLFVLWSLVPLGGITLVELVQGFAGKEGTATVVVAVSVCVALVGTLAMFLLVVDPEAITECSEG